MHTWVAILDAQIQAQSMQQEVEYVLGASVYFIRRLWAINEDCVLLFVSHYPIALPSHERLRSWLAAGAIFA